MSRPAAAAAEEEPPAGTWAGPGPGTVPDRHKGEIRSTVCVIIKVQAHACAEEQL